ncbi:MAG: hypothetical protein HY344_01865 [Candidatus Levybacteria bacterium]|nr:hypothetical protein [Candidatus Levybacteria bacterium]
MTEPDRPNLEQGEKTPEEREIALVRLWERGLDKIDCVAYHHTSLEAIEYLIANGGIPGHTGPETHTSPKLPQPGDVFFIPRILNFPFGRFPDLWDPKDDSKLYSTDAGSFASQATEDLPIAHRFCSLLGLDISRYGSAALCYVEDPKVLDFFDAVKLLYKAGLTDPQMDAATETAKTRKGIVVGLTRRALDKYPVSVGDQGNDIRVSTGLYGLPASALSGIIPLGFEEIAFLESLRIKQIQ